MNKIDKETYLSMLWLFVSLNYIFCDVFTLMHAPDLNQIMSGVVDGVTLDETFLFSFALMMEIPLLMIVLSRILQPKLNRRLNMITALFMTFLQLGSLFAGGNLSTAELKWAVIS